MGRGQVFFRLLVAELVHRFQQRYWHQANFGLEKTRGQPYQSCTGGTERQNDAAGGRLSCDAANQFEANNLVPLAKAAG